jgi:hypothetical protein
MHDPCSTDVTADRLKFAVSVALRGDVSTNVADGVSVATVHC